MPGLAQRTVGLSVVLSSPVLSTGGNNLQSGRDSKGTIEGKKK